jgi:DNA primase|tara:strand:- start:3220 stop:5088 length:1869 start_codon:yes stop_codon:yes gene_type:complete
MAFSEQFLEELRARTGLADVISRRVKLVKKGREHLGLCPFHKEKTPSFTVNEDKGFYHCFGCEAHGSAFDFVMETEGLTFPEAVEKLAQEAGMEVPRDTPEDRERQQQRQTLFDVTEKAAVFFERQLRMPEGKRALDYLKNRGFDDAIIKRFRLGFAPDGRNVLKAALAKDGIEEDLMVAAGLVIRPDDDSRESYDRFRGRVMFPITDQRRRVIAFGGRFLGDQEAGSGVTGQPGADKRAATGTDTKAPKYLNSPETPLFLKRRVLYGLKLASGPARKAGTIIVTEGYTDVIALNRAGFENAVAPLGTALTEDQIKLLWRIVPEPVLCFDGDDAGQKAAARAAERALPILASGFGLRFAMLPADEDPDSLIRSGGRDAMAGVIEGALPLSEVLWRMETGGRLPKTPEERAALQKRLRDYARQINDSTLRSHFSSLFNDRIWSGSRAGRKAPGRGGDWAPSMHLEDAAGPKTPVSALERAQKVLLAIIINHPEIFDGVEETLGKFSFGKGRFDLLRQEVISVLLKDAEMESDSVKDVLRERGYAESLDVLFRDPLISQNRHINAEATADEYQPLWNENVEFLKHQENAPEVEKVKKTGDAGIAEEDWEQTRALIEQSMPGSRD